MRSVAADRSRKDGDATANAFVQLAAELRSCMAFEPKKWTRVMAQSARVLQPDGNTTGGSPVAVPPLPGRRARGVPRRKRAVDAAAATGKRPRSREEDDDDDDDHTQRQFVALPRIASAPRKGNRPSPVAPTLAQYLSQPHLVDEILQELAEHDEADREAPDMDAAHPSDGNEAGESSSRGHDVAIIDGEDSAHDEPRQHGMAHRSQTGPAAPVLPVLSIVTPRTRAGLARLPALTADELRAIDELERLADAGARRSSLYEALRPFGHARSSPTRGFRHRKMATKADADEQTATVRAARHRALASPWKKRTPLSDEARQRAETIQMALEDVDAQHLQISPRARFARHAKDGTWALPSGLPSAVREKLQRDHAQLVEVQHATAADVEAAEARLDQTLAEIKQWIPLEVIYEFGLGKFASPAQQRAADVLFRVGHRLKNNLVVEAMEQWKMVVVTEKRVEILRSALLLQCWWRQVLAVREVVRRRRVRRELERRQRAMLILLASKENKSACTITRTIRRCGVLRRRENGHRRDQAARRIQRFWRHQQAAWIALRHHMRQEKRRWAAVQLQRHFRGFLARRRRRLLTRIKAVEATIAQRDVARVMRTKERYRLGAVVAIQRAFRAWVRRRIAALRRRRAQFERDKVKILQIQAHYRGRRARKLVASHREQCKKAVLVIQGAWRCYVARVAKAQRVRDRQAHRDAEAAAFAERQARRKARVLPLPTNLNTAAWGGLASKLAPVKNGKKNGGGPSAREIAAATRLQALWRGLKLRRRLKREYAREREMARRRVNRARREAAICIQRHVRGVQGRAKAWHMMVHRSATLIQGAWRGFTTRRELFRMRAALKALLKMQCRWRARRTKEIQGQRNAAARRIQRVWRRWIGKTWLYKAVRRQQYLAEEHAMGIALMKLTRSRVEGDLLMQSFIHRDVKILKTVNGVSDQDDDGEDIKSVQRSLYKVDSTKKLWKRRGYDGVWQELYRDISGNSFEIDNSRFARFLKALPRGFINQRNFPLQTVDLIFAKMKEPKSRTITFTRFNKAMAMVWQDKFTPTESKQATPPNDATSSGSPPSPDASKKHVEHEHFLRFMRDFVLPSTLNNGKYRKLLDASCTKRLEWAANVLRRFANRIAGNERHHKFIIVYRQHKLEQMRAHAARVLQRHYRVYKFRANLKETLARMFIEYIDYKGRSVRFEHIETKRVISAVNRRPAFLRGVRCQRVIPLPFPGEEFHAFCERHESAKDPFKKVPASVYCVECEDPMCLTCFSRDHDKRAALQGHEQHTISVCSHCHVETASRECLQCGDGKVPFCDVCFPFVHKTNTSVGADEPSNEMPNGKEQHRYRRLIVACVECEEKVAQWLCEVCEDVFCKRCLSKFHAKGQRQSHPCHRLSYFSVLKQKAEKKRRTDAQKQHDQKRKERDARRAEEERVRKLQESSATKIQAWTRSYQVRQKGKAYMKLVRQTNAAKAQRLKDERKRSSIGYKIKSVFGLQPSLKSDTREEIEARRRRIESIKRTLFFYRPAEDDEEGDAPSAGGDSSTGKGSKKKSKKRKKRWTKKARAAVEKAATTWLVYGVQVKILRGTEWKDAVGSILSTQNLFTTGHVVVFVPLANRSVVVNWQDISPYDEDEILRQPYVPPSQIAVDAAMNIRAKVTRFVDDASRRAKLMYLQSIEFHDVVQYAWVVEFNKNEQKEEYWNVVLNKRTFDVPKAMMLLERMEGEERDRVDARVALAKSKLLRLINPFQPLDKPRLVSRRHAVVALPPALKSVDADVYKRLRVEADALSCARFWQDEVVPNNQFGGKYALRFLHACSEAPRTTQDCWNMMKLLRWIELQDSDAYMAHAKTFFKKPPEVQMYIVKELTETIDSNDLKEAQANFERLIKLKEETVQLLISKAEQEALAAQDKEKT